MLGRGLESLIPQKDNKEAPETGKKSAPQAPSSDFFSSDNLEMRKDLAGSLSKPEENLKLNTQDPTPKIALERNQAGQELPKKHQEAIFLVELNEIKPNPHQPRRYFDEESLKELAASIQEFGILQPLLVSKIEEETENGTKVSYQLIAGERRFLAAKMLGLERVPAIIKRIDLEANRLEMAIIENIQREDLNPIESARAFAKLQDEFRLTQREIAQKVGKSREAVANTLRLLSLPSNIQDALAQKKINESQARMLLAVSDLNQQQALFQELINNNLSVRDLREKINPEETANSPEDPEKNYLENQLEEVLGTKVQINKNQNKGKIVIKFFSPEELDAIVKKICSGDQTS